MIWATLLLVLFAAFVVGMFWLTASAPREEWKKAPRPGASDPPVLVPVGPEVPRGQAALVAGGVAVPGERVTVAGEEWTVSEVEPFADGARAWLSRGMMPDRRKLLDHEVATIAAALEAELVEVANRAIAAIGEPYDETIEDVATLRVRTAMAVEADMCREWLVNVGVTSAADLPHEARLTCVHAGDGRIACDVSWLAHRIAARHVYGA